MRISKHKEQPVLRSGERSAQGRARNRVSVTELRGSRQEMEDHIK